MLRRLVICMLQTGRDTDMALSSSTAELMMCARCTCRMLFVGMPDRLSRTCCVSTTANSQATMPANIRNCPDVKSDAMALWATTPSLSFTVGSLTSGCTLPDLTRPRFTMICAASSRRSFTQAMLTTRNTSPDGSTTRLHLLFWICVSRSLSRTTEVDAPNTRDPLDMVNRFEPFSLAMNIATKLKYVRREFSTGWEGSHDKRISS
mmetsp:Transcript_44449/g.102596  ORF Transcript_44449/g.102596 Transcript_44449/m.102596 type:complete len:206 (-) Transcript_44449:162-779(-)